MNIVAPSRVAARCRNSTHWRARGRSTIDISMVIVAIDLLLLLLHSGVVLYCWTHWLEARGGATHVLTWLLLLLRLL